MYTNIVLFLKPVIMIGINVFKMVKCHLHASLIDFCFLSFLTIELVVCF